MSNCLNGYPKWFCLAKTVLVPKVDGSLTAADVQPISVLQNYTDFGERF